MTETGMLDLANAMWGNANELDYLALKVSVQRDHASRGYLAYVVATFLSFCHLASLKFMWDVRHHRA
jgi:hypothetical protein